jgi:dihydroxy-acid dehydratase
MQPAEKQEDIATMARKTSDELRSHRWFGVADLRSFGHRSRTKQMGYTQQDWQGKPVIGILNTWSDINPCHQHFRIRAEEVKRGVWQAGGFPLEIPALALPENFMKPTTMMYRNMLAMEVEEIARSMPLDGLVLMGGCDKTTPAMVMGALSMDLPSIFLPAGPMLSGYWNGHTLGSGSDSWKFWDELRAGNITEKDWEGVEDGIARSWGTCMTMGTASTMTSAVEALGLALPGSSSIPAADSNHARMATACGRRIVDMVWEDMTPSSLLTQGHFENAVKVAMALGGSTNSIIHLTAMAARIGMSIDLDSFDALSRATPLLANIRPSGSTYLMQDFYYAGGLRALMERLGDLLDRSAMTVAGITLGEAVAGAKVLNDDVIRPLDNPLKPEGGVAVLRGNLCPDGAVIKHSAADPRLLQHSGPAVVFENYNDMARRLDDPDLDVTPDSVLVLRNAGPIGGPGMPEWGMLPLPKKILKQGVRDMVRISDSRMSGTSYGTCVLHVAPESAVGGPLALVRSGDMIRLDVAGRRLTLEVDEAELAARRAAWTAPAPHYVRGFGLLHAREVTQANAGCDYRVLEGTAPTAEPEIH